jgi:hypothetical protein
VLVEVEDEPAGSSEPALGLALAPAGALPLAGLGVEPDAPSWYTKLYQRFRLLFYFIPRVSSFEEADGSGDESIGTSEDMEVTVIFGAPTVIFVLPPIEVFTADTMADRAPATAAETAPPRVVGLLPSGESDTEMEVVRVPASSGPLK